MRLPKFSSSSFVSLILHYFAIFPLMIALGVLLRSAPSIAAPWSAANAAWNVNKNPQLKPQEYWGEWPGHIYQQSPSDWRKISVYQFITDRFGDGIPENNDGKYGGYDVGSVSARHGGDFKGITARLDYIKSLGYNAIWISPIFQNRNNSYHGYGQIDFTLLDDRFGTIEEMREMVSEAHKRGIYVLVDIVVNHMSDLYYFGGFRGQHAPFHLHSGEYKLYPYNANETYTDFWVDNTYTTTGTYHEIYGSDGYAKTDVWGNGSFWNSDFHHNGDLYDYGNDWENHLGKIYGSLDDLRTTHPRVQDKIIAMTKSLIASTDIDGIRMDTPMQVPLYFFQRWAPAVKDFAASLGKNDFEIFGEFYVNRERAATMTGRGRTPAMWGQEQYISNTPTMDGGINYSFYWWTQDAINKQNNISLGNIKDVFDTDKRAYDFWNPRKNDWQFRHMHFYDNHDQWRLSTSTDGFKKTDLGSGVIAFWPGIPLFYYGDEQGFKTYGTALDGWSREDMMTSHAWRDLPTVDGKNPAEGDNFDMTNPHFLWVQKVMNVRRQYWTLQICDNVVEHWRQQNNSNGIYAYTRQCGTQDDWVFVAWNTWKNPIMAGGAMGALYTGWNAGDRIVNVLNPAEEYTVGANGILSQLWVGGYEVKAFVRKSVMKSLDPVVDWITPSHDQRINSDWIVRVHFSDDMDLDSVRAAFRYDGQAVPAAQLQWDAQNKFLQYAATAQDGIHTVEILESAKSVSGRNLYGKFRSRFRRGAEDNVIANPKNNWDTTLVTVVSTSTGDAIIHHKAVGAEKFRAKNEGGDWSPWAPYQPHSDWNVGMNAAGKVVTVQYWADNSSAYFMNCKTPGGQQPYETVYLRGTANSWEPLLMQSVGDNLWETTVTFGTTTNERFKLDIFGDWSLNYGDTDMDGIADKKGADIAVAPGTYKISFNGYTKAYSVKSTGPMPPVANAGPDIHTKIGRLVTLDASASYDPNGLIASYEWSNGLVGKVAKIVYGEVGTYNVTLTVSDDEGLQATDEIVITVDGNLAPVANAGADFTTAVGTAVTLDGSKSNDADGTIAKYEWSNGATGAKPSVSFNQAGVYDITLTVTDDDGATTTDVVSITVKPASTYPSMYFRGTPNAWGTMAMTLVDSYVWQVEVTFAASGAFKFDVYGDWKTNFGDTDKNKIAEASGANIAVAQAGMFRITFNDKTKAYSIGSAGPQSPIANAGADIKAITGDAVTFNANGSYDPDGQIVSYAWSNGLSGVTPTMVYSQAGHYDVTLTVTDNDDSVATDTVAVDVTDSFLSNYPSVNFRGTPNNFGKLAMELVANNIWRTQVNFAGVSVDRFKFDIYGDWKTSFGDTNKDGIAELGGGDIAMTQGAGVYQIDFNDQSKVYTVTKLASLTKKLPQLYFRGTPNGWGSTLMQLAANNTWKITVTTRNTTTERFKFDVYADWSYNLGDTDLNKTCERGGADIPLAANKTYDIVFSDLNNSYTITQK